jgi:hypothetical protein
MFSEIRFSSHHKTVRAWGDRKTHVKKTAMKNKLPNGYIELKQSWEKINHFKLNKGVSQRTIEYAPIYINTDFIVRVQNEIAPHHVDESHTIIYLMNGECVYCDNDLSDVLKMIKEVESEIFK